ncbi:FAD-linked oxidase C-terminal domain-containing protein [Chelatococcus sp. SYSU_G07232]|uniref:D-lactate dehydrogenase (cytochrome) n=1 Tax=Chelatococcus albus TaxID=3047466 RepID=A0ABT7AHY5_9HYPH|nr:FAD-linked oxidase C-terminal domain-containing protein [Chelatococcus sp. SYSU_G07232]MDJ1158587.1 FAD-linked oxidase C-terminal domain-containing protein [Chelatococcus sp. SYSU_G07232]
MTNSTPRPLARPAESAVAAVIEGLTQRFGNRVVTSDAVRWQHGHTLTWVPNQPPDAVVFPRTTEEVADIVRLCAAHRVPVIPFGTGTSLEGHVNAPFGGISVDTSQMKRIIAVHAEDLDAVVEPGVTRKELNEHLRDQGLFFPIDPGADASIGGMAATRASGTNAVRYGTMKDNVLALTVVMPDGSVVKTASRAKKTSAGYDLTRLIVGSEGTLGIITEITLRLSGIPEAVSAGICPFPSVRAACDAVIMTIQSGLPVARIELLDEVMMRGVNLHSKLGLPETPMLFLEFHGTEAGVKEQAERFGEIAAEFGGGPFDWATKAEDRTRLWQARHDAYWAALALRPGVQSVATDVCVPISRLADCLDETKRDIEAAGLVAPIAGHVGDGNFHTQPLVDMNNPEEVERCKAFIDRLVKRALAMEGTCTGEHGVGQKKMQYLEAEHGAATLDVMRTLKRAIDPLNIMNPGKIVAL